MRANWLRRKAWSRASEEGEPKVGGKDGWFGETGWSKNQAEPMKPKVEES